MTGTCDPRRESSSSLARMMIGGDLPHPRIATRRGATALVVRNLTLPADDPFGTSLSNINLTVRHGEVLGIAGVSGNGQKELMAALSGERPLRDTDTITILGVARGAHGCGRAPRARLRVRSRRSGSAEARCPRCRWPTTRC